MAGRAPTTGRSSGYREISVTGCNEPRPLRDGERGSRPGQGQGRERAKHQEQEVIGVEPGDGAYRRFGRELVEQPAGAVVAGVEVGYARARLGERDGGARRFELRVAITEMPRERIRPERFSIGRIGEPDDSGIDGCRSGALLQFVAGEARGAREMSFGGTRSF